MYDTVSPGGLNQYRRNIQHPTGNDIDNSDLSEEKKNTQTTIHDRRDQSTISKSIYRH